MLVCAAAVCLDQDEEDDEQNCILAAKAVADRLEADEAGSYDQRKAALASFELNTPDVLAAARAAAFDGMVTEPVQAFDEAAAAQAVAAQLAAGSSNAAAAAHLGAARAAGADAVEAEAEVAAGGSAQQAAWPLGSEAVGVQQEELGTAATAAAQEAVRTWKVVRHRVQGFFANSVRQLCSVTTSLES